MRSRRPTAEDRNLADYIRNLPLGEHRIERIVDMPIDRHLDIGMQLKLLGIKKDAAQSMAALQARVDGNSLKAREVDMMPELIERLAKIEGAKE